MSFLGTMENWHGDEYECHNDCGMCDNCDRRYYELSDADYEENAE